MHVLEVDLRGGDALVSEQLHQAELTRFRQLGQFAERDGDVSPSGNGPHIHGTLRQVARSEAMTQPVETTLDAECLARLLKGASQAGVGDRRAVAFEEQFLGLLAAFLDCAGHGKTTITRPVTIVYAEGRNRKFGIPLL